VNKYLEDKERSMNWFQDDGHWERRCFTKGFIAAINLVNQELKPHFHLKKENMEVFERWFSDEG